MLVADPLQIEFLHKNAVLVYFHLGKHPCEEYETSIQTAGCKKCFIHFHTDHIITYKLDNVHVVFSIFWNRSKTICNIYFGIKKQKKTFCNMPQLVGKIMVKDSKTPFLVESKRWWNCKCETLLIPSETTITSERLMKLPTRVKKTCKVNWSPYRSYSTLWMFPKIVGFPPKKSSICT